MAQARRIKKKPEAKKTKPFARLAGLPWGLMCVILVSGIVLGMLILGSQQNNAPFGQGLKVLIDEQQSDARQEQAQSGDMVVTTDDAAIPTIVVPVVPEFDYYQVLPDIEQVMPQDLPEDAVVARRDEGFHYFVQIASFRQFADAEALRAKLALQGIVALTQASEVAGKGLYYRVRLGPFANSRLAKTAKGQVSSLGQDPFVYRVALVQPANQ